MSCCGGFEGCFYSRLPPNIFLSSVPGRNKWEKTVQKIKGQKEIFFFNF